MEIKSLQMFQHLAHSLHFGKTAQACFVSPSTLSRVIQRLEQQLGCRLLYRDNRTVQLTDSGRQLLAFADQQLLAWQQLQQSIGQHQAQLTGKLHLYCSVTASYSHLPALLDKFRQQHPLIEIMITTGDAADGFDQVQQKTVDVAIAAYPENLSKSIFFHPIAEVPLSVIAPNLACRVQQLLNEAQPDWSKVPIIIAEHGPARKRFKQWYRKRQQGKANIYATVSGYEAIVSMVALGCGVGIAPQVVIDHSPVKERVQCLHHLGTVEPFELGVCCLKSQQNQTVISAFFTAITT